MRYVILLTIATVALGSTGGMVLANHDRYVATDKACNSIGVSFQAAQACNSVEVANHTVYICTEPINGLCKAVNE